MTGTVRAGRGIAAGLMAGADWGPLGYKPVPGSLNLVVADTAPLALLAGGVTVRLPAARTGRDRWLLHPVRLWDVRCHLKQQPARGQVELLAPVNLRVVLGLLDGDTVQLTIPGDPD